MPAQQRALTDNTGNSGRLRYFDQAALNLIYALSFSFIHALFELRACNWLQAVTGVCSNGAVTGKAQPVWQRQKQLSLCGNSMDGQPGQAGCDGTASLAMRALLVM